MTVNTKLLLKILPIEEKISKETIENFENLTEDQKLAIREYCWTMFYSLINSEIKYEFDKTLIEIKEGKRDLVKNLYREIEKSIHNKYSEILLKEEESLNLELVRHHLKQLHKKIK